MVEIIKKGFLNNPYKTNVTIIKQDWDFYFEEGFEDDAPDLNNEGLAYYILWGDYKEIKDANRSKTFLSLEESINFIENNYSIYWL